MVEIQKDARVRVSMMLMCDGVFVVEYDRKR